MGFKALPNAPLILEMVERWRDAHRTIAEHEITDFVDELAGATGEPHASGAARTVTNELWGLSFSVPVEWDVRVRQRHHAFGRIALERSKWQSPDELTTWNAIRVEGPYHSAVELHLDRVAEPTQTLDTALSSVLYRLLAGAVVDSEPDASIGRFRGFSVTRNHVVHGPRQGFADRSRPALTRFGILHDGDVQMGVIATWPDDSEPLKAAVDSVLESVTVGPLDPATVETLPATVPRRSCVGRVFGAARLLLFGLAVFSLAVYSAWDQGTRLERTGQELSSTWMGYSIFGLMLILRPLASPFDWFQAYTRAPFVRRLGITVALAAGITLLIGASLPG